MNNTPGETVHTLGRQIARRLRSVSWNQMTASAQGLLKLCLTANLSAAVAGETFTRLPCPPACAGDQRGGHILFSGRRTAGALDAVAWNAAAMHARMQDDMNAASNLHAGTVVVPAAVTALEYIEEHGAKKVVSGVDFLSAIAAGYAAASGLSRAFNKLTTPRGFRSSSLYGIFGAAATSGLLMELGEVEMESAISLSASMAAGSSQCWLDGSEEWQLHIAQAASNGFLAARLARDGFRGAAHALDGKAGFYASHAGKTVVWSDISADFEVEQALQETLIKRYPMSGIVQPVAYIAERMVRAQAFSSEDIAAVQIAMNPFEMRYPGTVGKGPFSSFSSVLMSAPFASASVFTRGRFVFEDLMDFSQPERDRIVQVTTVVADDDLPSLSCRIRVELRNGKVVEDQLSPRSDDIQLGLDSTNIEAWSRELWASAGRSPTAYSRFVQTIADLENRPANHLLDALATRDS